MRDKKSQNERVLRRQRKKRRLKRSIVLFLFILFVAVGYMLFQYQQGLISSRDEANIDLKEYEFSGEKDQYGGTNILLLGSDSRGEEQARADTIMIAQYHPKKHSYKLISIMRDTYVDIPGYGKNRINAAFAYGGPELLRQTVKENFNINTQYYALIDFNGFTSLIDEAFPQGVKVEVEKEMSDYIDVTLEPGIQYLDGKHLLGYVRFRNDALGDFNRVMRQQKVMKEVAAQFATIQTLPKLPKLIGVIKPYVNTNMDTLDIIYIGKDYLSKDNREIDTMRIPIEGGFRPERINGIGEVLRMNLPANVEAVEAFLEK
jgi:polyisoprenyl-teichoic acid--peptidoglycan teichoic acid transferase